MAAHRPGMCDPAHGDGDGGTTGRLCHERVQVWFQVCASVARKDEGELPLPAFKGRVSREWAQRGSKASLVKAEAEVLRLCICVPKLMS